MSASPTQLTVWTFADEHGQQHPAIPVAETELGGQRYTLAVSDRRGLLVLQERGGRMTAVRDAQVMEKLAAALRSVMDGQSEPVLSFDAKGPDGRVVHCTARTVVAHGGRSYLVTQAQGPGAPLVFEAGANAPPLWVSDAALARTVAALEPPAPASAPHAVTLTLANGKTRSLQVEQETQQDGHRYALAVDTGNANAVYLLRMEQDGRVVPVSDVEEVQRVQQALAGHG